MEDTNWKPLRIEEPFLKGQLALWLPARGAVQVRVSVDGAEPNPDTIRQLLSTAGYLKTSIAKSRPIWTGLYARDQTEITVVSRPGIDIEAALGDGTIFVAECKGEATQSGIRAGTDLTSLYTALGQLIRRAGEMSTLPQEKALVIPDTGRLRRIAREIARNQFIQLLGIALLLVDAQEKVSRA